MLGQQYRAAVLGRHGSSGAVLASSGQHWSRIGAAALGQYWAALEQPWSRAETTVGTVCGQQMGAVLEQDECHCANAGTMPGSGVPMLEKHEGSARAALWRRWGKYRGTCWRK